MATSKDLSVQEGDEVTINGMRCRIVAALNDSGWTLEKVDEPVSLHEKIFWQIRSSGMDERELADWVCALAEQEITRLPRTVDSNRVVDVVDLDDAIALFKVPEGRSAPEVAQAVEEHFAATGPAGPLRCQAAIHPGSGRTVHCRREAGHVGDHVDQDGQVFHLPPFVEGQASSTLCGYRLFVHAKPCQRIKGHEGSHQAF